MYSIIQSETKHLMRLKIKILNIDEILHFVQNDTFQTASFL
jgi:predicted XRE-type DNA-binding protein